jgi:hypothetical protein
MDLLEDVVSFISQGNAPISTSFVGATGADTSKTKHRRIPGLRKPTNRFNGEFLVGGPAEFQKREISPLDTPKEKRKRL